MRVDSFEGLLDLLSGDWREDDPWIRLLSASQTGEQLELMISVLLHSGKPTEQWVIGCVGVVEERLSFQGADFLDATQTDSCLIRYHERKVSIYLPKTRVERHVLLGIVCDCHTRVVGGVDGIDQYLNPALTMGSGNEIFGLLGSFPESVGVQVAAELEKLNVAVKLAVSTSSTNTSKQLFALRFGESFVVAESFSARRA